MAQLHADNCKAKKVCTESILFQINQHFTIITIAYKLLDVVLALYR